MPGEEIVELRHLRKTSCKEPLLKGESLSYNSFVSEELGIGVDLKFPIETPPIGLVSGWGGGLRW